MVCFKFKTTTLLLRTTGVGVILPITFGLISPCRCYSRQDPLEFTEAWARCIVALDSLQLTVMAMVSDRRHLMFYC